MSAIETATLPMMLTELRLPTIKRLWPALAEQSNREGWPAERFLAALCEHEMHERESRRIDRHRAESALPPDKRLSAFDFAAVPTVSKAHVTALAEGDSWLEQGANIPARGLKRESRKAGDIRSTGRCFQRNPLAGLD